VGTGLNAGFTSSATYEHYSLLHTIEAARGVPALTSNDGGAATMTDMFASGPVPTPTSTPTPTPTPTPPPAAPTPCTAVNLGASPASPQHPGTSVTLTAVATGCPNPLYQLWMMPPSGGPWQLKVAYRTNGVFTWNNTGLALGSYSISIWARDAGSAGVYTNGLGGYDAFDASQSFTLSGGCSSVGASSAPSTSASVGSPVTITGSASGCTGATPQYEFWVLGPGAASWQAIQPYSTSATLAWTTSGLALGSYRFSVWVRDGAMGTSSNALGDYDAFNASQSITLDGGCAAVSVSTNPAVSATLGTQVVVSANAAGCSSGNPQYQFWVLLPSGGGWQIAQPYSTSPTFSWSTSGLSRGPYRFSVWVKDGAGVYSNALGGYDAFNASQYYALT
jgi:hypothetical protein